MRVCVLASGSSGNSILVESEETKLLIDAGLSGKRIKESLKEVERVPEEIDGILITHEHQDHVKGAGILSRRHNLPIYANEATWSEMEQAVGKIAPENKCILEESMDFSDLKVECHSTFHDAADSLSFSFFAQDKKASIITDTGKLSQELKEEMATSDMLVLESNHDVEMLKVGPYTYALKRRILSNQGHLSNVQAGEALVETMTGEKQQVMLAHLSRENNFPELAFQTVQSILNKADIQIDDNLEVNVAKPHKVSKIMRY